MSQVYYRKWRPQALAEVVGQEAVTRTLANALASGKVAHAYLFAGPRGTGKTSTARILAKAVNCLKRGTGEPCNACPSCLAFTQGQALDLIEIDAASNRGIDDARSLREKVNFAPAQARFKVYIIDEAHQLTTDAFNALLKTLEEPPPHAIFILATTEPHKVPPTIISRCQRFDFRRLPQGAMVARLEQICALEGLRVETGALNLIARSAGGSLRDAENLLEQLVTYYGPEASLGQVRQILGLMEEARVRELLGHLFRRELASGLATINALSQDGLDLRQCYRELMDCLRELLRVKAGAEVASDAELAQLAAAISLEEVMRALRLMGQADLRTEGPLPLELALAEFCASSPRASDPTTPRPAQPQERPRPQVERKETALPEKPTLPVARPLPADPGARLEYLKAQWRRLLEEAPAHIKRSTALALLRQSCKPVALDGDTLVLEFRHQFHRDAVEKLENKRLAEEFLSHALGMACRVQCVVSEAHREALSQVAADPLVQEAVRLGGRIVGVEDGHEDE